MIRTPTLRVSAECEAVSLATSAKGACAEGSCPKTFPFRLNRNGDFQLFLDALRDASRCSLGWTTLLVIAAPSWHFDRSTAPHSSAISPDPDSDADADRRALLI